jgi:hypothetical protein
MDVIMELACLIRREFDGHDRFWEGGTGIVPLFVNEDGAVKLKREWPKIWESFELDKTNE